MGCVTLFFPRLSKDHIVKDVFLFPYEMARQTDKKLIVYGDSTIVEQINCDNVVFNKTSKGKSCFFSQMLSVFKVSKETDILVMFHFRWYTLVLAMVYKFGNRHGQCYVKGDLSKEEAAYVKSLFENKGCVSWKDFFKKQIIHCMAKYIDLLTVETERAYQVILSSKINEKLKKIAFVPNGLVNHSHVVQLPKEKIIINVARLGTYQKNTEFLLEVLSGLDLDDWKFFFVGPIEDSFRTKISQFYDANKSLKDKVFFVGPIKNKSELNELFSKSSIFCLSSRFESYGLVLSEAAQFNNFIITTNVGAAEDLILTYCVEGIIVDQNIESFRACLLKKMKDYPININNDLSQLNISTVVENVLENLKISS